MSAAIWIGLVGSRLARIRRKRLAAGIASNICGGIQFSVGAAELVLGVLTEAVAAEPAGALEARTARTILRGRSCL
jgi:hypothetical protein